MKKLTNARGKIAKLATTFITDDSVSMVDKEFAHAILIILGFGVQLH